MRIRLQGGIWDGVEFQANIAPAELRLRSFESTSEDFTNEDLYKGSSYLLEEGFFLENLVEELNDQIDQD